MIKSKKIKRHGIYQVLCEIIGTSNFLYRSFIIVDDFFNEGDINKDHLFFRNCTFHNKNKKDLRELVSKAEDITDINFQLSN